jgi:polyisoprenyl-teichoic acid--peptidoglycan teichoic acid transferase
VSTQNPNRPVSPKPSKSSSPKKQGRLPRWVGLGVALAGVASVAATAGALLALSLSSTPLMQGQLSPEEAEVFGQGSSILAGNNLRLPRLTRPVNILVLGVKVLSSDVVDVPPELRNLRYHALVDSFEGRSDTMLLLRFNPQTEQLVILSLPRDTRTYVNGSLTKLNEANIRGGPALAATSVSDLLGGVAIDRYVRINVQGVEKLFDALGGVNVNVPQNMKYQDDSQRLYINLKAGEQRLNGDQALQFLRFRYDEKGDIGRIQRQQMMMRAFVDQVLNPATVARLPQILSVIQEHVDTNLTVEELLALVGYGAQTNRSNVQMLMLPGDFSHPEDFDLSYWIPNYSEIDTMMAQYFGARAATASTADDPSYLRIAIQDGTGDAVAVQALVDTLYESGYTNVYTERGWNQDLPITRILAQQGDVASAEMLHRFLRVGEVRVESTGSLSSDVTIQLGQDWLDEHGNRL